MTTSGAMNRVSDARMPGRRIVIGTAGWSIPRASAASFHTAGTHLERYACLLTGAEINSSFYRAHAPATYSKWAQATPPEFRFAVKVPRLITHEGKLLAARAPLEAFLRDIEGLGPRRGPLLVQLPPSLVFDSRTANRFFTLLRSRVDGPAVCEPRHPSWFDAPAERLLRRYEIARVAADPAPVEGGDTPGAWTGMAYFRLHGSPRKYWSRYPHDYIAALAAALQRLPVPEVWCVFDNTASGAAIENALELQRLVAADGDRPSETVS